MACDGARNNANKKGGFEIIYDKRRSTRGLDLASAAGHAPKERP
jgi:hypothetical protein